MESQCYPSLSTIPPGPWLPPGGEPGEVHTSAGPCAWRLRDAESRTRVLTRRQKSRQSYRGFAALQTAFSGHVSGYDVLYGTGSTPHSERPGNESSIRPVLRLTGTLMRYVFKYFCLMSYAVCNPSVPHHQPLPSALTEVPSSATRLTTAFMDHRPGDHTTSLKMRCDHDRSYLAMSRC